MVDNLYKIPVPTAGELFKTLFENENVKIEAIVSSENPEETLYNQPHDEAVFLLEGSATIWLEEEEIRLEAGDFLLIPAYTRHRVTGTKKGTRWLAVHLKEPIC